MPERETGRARSRLALDGRVLLSRLAAVIGGGAYLLYLGWGLAGQVLGDTGESPVAAYFVTWDMFPGHRSTCERVLVVGETEQGEFVRLYPSPRQRWRGGANGELTRLEYAPSVFLGAPARWLEREIAEAIRGHDRIWPNDPIRGVEVIRELS